MSTSDRRFRSLAAFCLWWTSLAQRSQYFARLDFGTNAAPHTVQCLISPRWRISASIALSCGRMLHLNHLQLTEYEMLCGQVCSSPSSRMRQLPLSQLQHSRRIKAFARFRCFGVMRGNEPSGLRSIGGRFLMIFLIAFRSFLLVFGRP